MDPSITVCLPQRLHPVSETILNYWLGGEFTTHQFLRWFHMPNSDYLEVAQCLLRVVSATSA